MLKGLLCLPSPALEEAPSVDEKLADLIHVAWSKVDCGCLSGGLEGSVVEDRVAASIGRELLLVGAGQGQVHGREAAPQLSQGSGG